MCCGMIFFVFLLFIFFPSFPCHGALRCVGMTESIWCCGADHPMLFLFLLTVSLHPPSSSNLKGVILPIVFSQTDREFNPLEKDSERFFLHSLLCLQPPQSFLFLGNTDLLNLGNLCFRSVQLCFLVPLSLLSPEVACAGHSSTLVLCSLIHFMQVRVFYSSFLLGAFSI